MEKIKKLLNKILVKRNATIFGVLLFMLVAGVMIFPVHAAIDWGNEIGSALITMLSWLFMAIIDVLGTLLIKTIEILIRIANYGDFLTNPIVEKGWIVIRDVANIIIVLALLVMAFATIMRKGSYQYQNLLVKLVIAAVMINFSKLLTGAMITVGQVFMMYFVNAFQGAAAGNLVYGFGLHDLLAFRETADIAGLEVNQMSIFGSLVLGTLMVVVAFLVVISLVIFLLFRILALWFLAIFSPLAFMSGILPSMGSIGDLSARWWKELNKWVWMGPVVAFMLWLSLAVITEMTTEKRIINLHLQSAEAQGATRSSNADWNAFASKVSGTQNIVDYLVTTGLLIATLMIAKSLGGKASGFAGASLNKLQGYGQKVVSGAQRTALAPVALGKKVGAAGIQKSQIPAIATAATARFKTSTVGKTLGLDKEHKENVAGKRQARWNQLVGGKSDAILQQRRALAKKAGEKIESAGGFMGGEEAIRQKFMSAVAGGKKEDAMAYLNHMASEKGMNVKNTDLRAYEDKFRSSVRKEPGEENMWMQYKDELKTKQEASGDAMAAAVFGVQRDSQGKVSEVVNKKKWAETKFGKMEEKDFDNKSLTKGFNVDQPEFVTMFEQMAKKKDFKAMGSSRKDHADNLQKILSKAQSGEIKLDEKMAKFDASGNLVSGEFKGLMKNLKAVRFDNTTGEAITTETMEKPSDNNAIRKANESFMESIEVGGLNKAGEKMKRGESAKKRDDRYYGREDLSDIDKEVDKGLLRPLAMDKVGNESMMRQMSMLRADATNTNDDITTTSGTMKQGELLVNRYTGLREEIRRRANEMSVDRINPETNTLYTGEEILAKTQMGKSMDRLDTVFNDPSWYSDKDNRKEVAQLVDSLQFDFQRAQMPEGKVTERGSGEWLRKRQLKNREINKKNIGSAVNKVKRLQNEDLTGTDRFKLINGVISDISVAYADTKKYDKDNVAFIESLKMMRDTALNMHHETSSPDNLATMMQTFYDRINVT